MNSILARSTFFASACLLGSLQALAATPSYKIEVESLAPGSVPRSGSAIVAENESGKVLLADTLVRFLPSTLADGTVKINALVVRRNGKSESIIAQPSVVTKDGSPAEISELDAHGKLLYRLRFTPRSQSDSN
jgi:hypothetical protein